jgi:hypothetical protein
MRIIIHHGHELATFANDGFALPPGERCCEESGNFDILLFVNECGMLMGSFSMKPGWLYCCNLFIEKIF